MRLSTPQLRLYNYCKNQFKSPPEYWKKSGLTDKIDARSILIIGAGSRCCHPGMHKNNCRHKDLTAITHDIICVKELSSIPKIAIILIGRIIHRSESTIHMATFTEGGVQKKNKIHNLLTVTKRPY